MEKLGYVIDGESDIITGRMPVRIYKCGDGLWGLGVEFFNDKGEEAFEFIEIGDKFFLRGSVKCLSTYKREDQVVLTRVTPEFIVKKDFMSEEEVKEFKRGLQLSKLKDVEIKTISYREYKGSYSIYETVADSFKRTDNGCFIDVIIPKHETSSLYYFSE